MDAPLGYINFRSILEEVCHLCPDQGRLVCEPKHRSPKKIPCWPLSIRHGMAVQRQGRLFHRDALRALVEEEFALACFQLGQFAAGRQMPQAHHHVQLLDLLGPGMGVLLEQPVLDCTGDGGHGPGRTDQGRGMEGFFPFRKDLGVAFLARGHIIFSRRKTRIAAAPGLADRFGIWKDCLDGRGGFQRVWLPKILAGGADGTFPSDNCLLTDLAPAIIAQHAGRTNHPMAWNDAGQGVLSHRSTHGAGGGRFAQG